MTAETAPETALTGLRVLDLSESIAGQFCSRLMADYGAQVLLVEPPPGSCVRAMAPFRGRSRGSEDSLLFWHLNTGKGSLSLDWQQPSGERLLHELAQQADVVISGLSLEVDRGALRDTNSRLVTCLVSDFGESGPYAAWHGSEMIHQALAGTMLVTGHPHRPPLYGFGHRTAYATGLSAYITILAALFARDTTGVGQDVEATVMESAAAMGQVFATQYFYNQTHFERGRYPNVVSLVRCRDGWVVPFAGLRWRALCKAFGVEELVDDQRFAALPTRQKHWREALAIFQAKAETMSAKDIVDTGQRGKASISRVMTIQDLWESPHLRERAFWEDVPTPDGPRTVLGPAFRMSQSPRCRPAPAPTVGRDTLSVLGTLPVGVTQDEAELLREGSVV